MVGTVIACRSNRRHVFLAAVGMSALCASQPAAAQVATPVPRAEVDQDHAAAAVTDDDIVVTARRREERLQDVPIAVTVLSGEALDTKGIQSVQDLRISVPALQVAPSNLGPAIPGYTIRGQRQLEGILTQDPSVGFYFADVVQQRPHGTNQALYDIASVQVLKGPQGTLFGRNVTGGAVLITPERPKFDFGGSITGTLGTLDLRGVTAVLNVPLTDRFAIRAAGKVQSRGGYGTNLTSGTALDGQALRSELNDQDVESFRVGALWRPTDTIESYTVGSYTNSRSSGVSTAINALRAGSSGQLLFASAAALQRQQGRDPTVVENDGAGPTRVVTYDISNTSTLELGQVTLKNIAGYRKVNSSTQIDYDGTPFAIWNNYGRLNAWQYSDEFQILGTGLSDKLSYILGAYYFKEGGYENTITNVNRTIGSRQGQVENTSKSLFAQANFEVLPGLTLTGGYRYTWDDRYLDLQSRISSGTNILGICRLQTSDANTAPLNPCSRVTTAKFSADSYLVSASYKINSDTMIYASHSTGYRSGGLNFRAVKPSEGIPFEPETVMNYEIGFKTDLFRRLLQINAALYQSDYSDIQRTLVNACPGAPLQQCTNVVNAATAVIKGGEVEATVRPARWLSLTGFYGYVEAKYSSFVTPQGQDLSGNEFAYAPKATFGGSVELTLPVPDQDISISANYYEQSSAQTNDQNDGPRLPAYSLVNASANWRGIGGASIDLRLFVNNVFDNSYHVAEISLVGSFGTNSAIIAEPRTAGLAVTYRF